MVVFCRLSVDPQTLFIVEGQYNTYSALRHSMAEAKSPVLLSSVGRNSMGIVRRRTAEIWR
jgi:hypothetical protein